MNPLNQTRHPYRLAEIMNLPLKQVRALLDGTPENLPGWGRIPLQRYIVSRRHVSSYWPREDLDILNEMKHLHDRGRVTMCQGRDGDFFIQYAIPTRGRPIRRGAYFYAV